MKQNKLLDFERSNKLSVLIQCDDSGFPKQSLTKQISISIADVNEQSISISLSKNTVAENAGLGTIIGEINVEDPDRGQTHSCALLRNPFDTFEISGNVFKVKQNMYLNYEFKSVMDVIIQCNDSGLPMQSIKKELSIKVTDVNERPQYLSMSNYRVPENSANKLVGTLKTRDPDKNDVKFHYELVRGMDFFTLVNNKLFTKIEFNYEKRRSYGIEIRSTDCAGIIIIENIL